MERYNADVRQHLKWLQNEAPYITSLTNKKALWIDKYHEEFWAEWYANVYNINTANQFGLSLWCIILGVSSDLFNFNPATQRWAFGANRENFVYDDKYHSPALPAAKQSKGGNFGNDETALTNLDDIRTLLKFRYATLVSNGRIQYMNMMMNWILNKGELWDVANKKYAYAIDSTSKGSPIAAKVYINDWQGLREIPTGPSSARQLYLINSEVLSSPQSTLSEATVASDSSRAPDGQVDADSLVPTTANAEHSVTLTTAIAYPSDQRYMTYSVFMKANGYSKASITITNTQSGQPDEQVTYNTIDLQSRTVGGGGTTRAIYYSGGWIRVFITFPVISGQTASKIKINILDDNGKPVFAGNTKDGLLIWGWLQEAGQENYKDYASCTTVASATIPAQVITSAGVLSFGRVPLAGMKIYWSGTWGIGGYPSPMLFATADGVLNAFQIPKPLNDGQLITAANYIEFRIGKNVPISQTLIDLMNERSNGLIFQNACVTYKVIKES